MLQFVLSENATGKLRELMKQNGDAEKTYLRVFVAGGGCSGFRYGMALDEKLHEGDEVLQSNGIKVIVDKESAPYIDGASVDYVESVAGSGFVVSNPNNVSSCGCGQSFTPKGEAAPDQAEGHQADAHSH